MSEDEARPKTSPSKQFRIINDQSEICRALSSPVLLYFLPCHLLFSVVWVILQEPQKKKYYYKDMMTPYEKLKSIAHATDYLKENITFERLDDIATTMSDNQAADYLQLQRKRLFIHIHEDCKKRA